MVERVSWEEYDHLIKNLVKRIRNAKRKFDTIVIVTRGWMVPAYHVASSLGIRKFQTLCVQSYEWTERKEIKALSYPTWIDLKKTLFVDDICDSGNTLDYIRAWYPNAYVASLIVRPMWKKPNYFAQEREGWIVFPWEKD